MEAERVQPRHWRAWAWLSMTNPCPGHSQELGLQSLKSPKIPGSHAAWPVPVVHLSLPLQGFCNLA